VIVFPVPTQPTKIVAFIIIIRYFAQTEVRQGMRLERLYHQRLLSFERQLALNATGFMIEKDKCAMLNFFQQQNIRIPRVVGIFHEKEAMYKMFEQVQTSSTSYNYPLFVKACHLTQGGDKGTKPAFAKNFTKGHMQKYLFPWVEKKWRQRPTDDNRPWSGTMNHLLSYLKPGIALQTPFRGLRISPEHIPLETKVEVVWGRAYLALFPDYHDIIALRGGKFEYTDRRAEAPEQWTNGNVPDNRLKWMVDGGHMEAVWALAEDVARAIGIDEIRVDVFVDPERPESPMVNEISLSSGHNYMFHAANLARAWIGPHIARLAAERSESKSVWPVPILRRTTKQVHLQTVASVNS